MSDLINVYLTGTEKTIPRFEEFEKEKNAAVYSIRRGIAEGLALATIWGLLVFGAGVAQFNG